MPLWVTINSRNLIMGQKFAAGSVKLVCDLHWCPAVVLSGQMQTIGRQGWTVTRLSSTMNQLNQPTSHWWGPTGANSARKPPKLWMMVGLNRNKQMSQSASFPKKKNKNKKSSDIWVPTWDSKMFLKKKAVSFICASNSRGMQWLWTWCLLSARRLGLWPLAGSSRLSYNSRSADIERERERGQSNISKVQAEKMYLRTTSYTAVVWKLMIQRNILYPSET